MKVWVVTFSKDNGMLVGVFSALDKASKYVSEHSYNAYTITEMTVDEACDA